MTRVKDWRDWNILAQPCGARLGAAHLQREDLPLVVREDAHLAVTCSSEGVSHELDLRRYHED
jgi:hypothetical protein